MKKIIAVLMTIVMVLSGTVCSFAAGKPIKYIFKWGEYFTQEPRTVECYYSDSYFNQKSSQYNKHLASASMALSLTGTRSLKSENAIDALKKIGCKNITSITNNGAKELVFGKKKIKNGTLVIINSKATYGLCEWDNNVYFGSSGDVAGYMDICNATYKKLVAYVKNDKNVKFWISGHSRGGAIANVVGKRLSDKFGKKNVYAYCFDNPMTTTCKNGNDKYTNIHNIQIKESGAGVLIPAFMGFDRYGRIDKVFTSENDHDAAMMAMLSNISDVDYWSAADFKWAKIDKNLLNYLDDLGDGIGLNIIQNNMILSDADSMEKFWQAALQLLEQIFESREKYVSLISTNAATAAEEIGCDTVYTAEQALKSAAVHIYNIIQYKDMPDHEDDPLLIGGKQLLKSKKLAALILAIGPVLSGKKPAILSDSSKYAAWVNTLWKESGLERIMSESEQQDTKLMLATLSEILLNLIRLDVQNEHQVIATALYNTHRLYDCHLPVAMMAYLMADDSYYK